MQVHLLSSTSEKPLLRQMGRNHLQLCTIVVEELRRTYFGAELLYQMFSKAVNHIEGRPDRREQANHAISSEARAIELQNDTSLVNSISDTEIISRLGYPFTGYDISSEYEYVYIPNNLSTS